MRLIRERDLDAVDGLSRSTRRRLIHAGRYPAPIKLSQYRIAWLEADVDRWIIDRARESGRTDLEPVSAA